MPSTYTGVSGNIGAFSPITTTIPADGDSLAVSSVNTALQKLTDYIAYLESQFSPAVVSFGANGVPSTASTNYWMWLAGLGGTTAPGTATASGRTVFTPLAAGRIIGLSYSCSGTTAGGSIIIAAGVGGSLTTAVTFAAGSVAPSGSVSLNLSFTGPTGGLEVVVQNGAGVTAGLGNVSVNLFISRA